MDRESEGRSWTDTLRDLASARHAAPRGRRAARATGDPGRPWLENRAWQGGPIRSTALVDVRFMALFAVTWLALTTIILFPVPSGDEPPGIDTLLMMAFFPLAGIAMLAYVWHKLRDYRRFGPLPLTLTPFPARLGGQVAGRIDAWPAGADTTDARVTLTLVRRRKGRESTVETPVFDAVARTRTLAPPSGPALAFSADVPDTLPGSTLVREGESFVWSIVLESSASGLSRRYEIPVYAARGSAAASAEGVRTDIGVAKARAADAGTEEPVATIAVSARQRVVVRRMVVGGTLLCSAMWFWTFLSPPPDDFHLIDVFFLLLGVAPLLALPHALRRVEEMTTVEKP